MQKNRRYIDENNRWKLFFNSGGNFLTNWATKLGLGSQALPPASEALLAANKTLSTASKALPAASKAFLALYEAHPAPSEL